MTLRCKKEKKKKKVRAVGHYGALEEVGSRGCCTVEDKKKWMRLSRNPQ